MFAGTSTGGLVALSLTAPDPDKPGRPAVSADLLARFYTEDGPKIFHRSVWQKLITLWGWLGPKYTPRPARGARSSTASGRPTSSTRSGSWSSLPTT